jgi:nicotinate-nucleotide pyrophosphorylase (carboxylating)
VAGGRCLQRSSQSGEATADHHHPLHAPAARWNGMGLAEEQGCFLEVLHASAFMGKGAKVPHDRGHLLWTPTDGPSNRLLASIDRWVGAVLADDGIDMPLMGRSDTATATVISRSEGLVAGTAAVDHLLQIWAPEVRVSWSASDGRQVGNGDEVGQLTGPADVLLAIERSVLNLLGHLSGIATSARAWATVAPGQVACTRKTVLGLMDKWAVDLGGCLTHRLNRKDALMLKENDLVAYGDDDISRVQSAVLALEPDDAHAFIEIETTSAKQALAAALAWSQHRSNMGDMPLVIMLDNFGPEACKDVASEMEELGVREHVILEASGGITIEGLSDWKESGMDVVSTSAVNRGVAPLDLTMLMDGV